MVLFVYLMFTAFSWSLDSSPGNFHGIDNLLDLEQESASSFYKWIDSKYCHMVSVAATRFCRCRMKTDINSMYRNGHDCISKKLYLQKQVKLNFGSKLANPWIFFSNVTSNHVAINLSDLRQM